MTTQDEDFIVEQDQTVSTEGLMVNRTITAVAGPLTNEQRTRVAALYEARTLLTERGLLGGEKAAELNDLIKLATWILDGSDEPLYPFASGDVVVLGPQVFASSEGNVINWLGANYNKQEDE